MGDDSAMESVVFADPSNLQLVLTRLIYEDRTALPLSWRRALGFRRMLAAAQSGSAGRATSAPRLVAPQLSAAQQVPARQRRDPASRGTPLRRRSPVMLANASAPPAPRAGRAPVREIAVALARAVHEGRTFCTLDLSTEGLGRVQVFIRRRGERVDCAVLCAREVRTVVARALAEARALLERGGMALVGVLGGEAYPIGGTSS